MSTILDRIDELKISFNQYSNWEDRYTYLIEMGKKLNEMNPSYKIEANLVKGCQSQVWLFAELKDRKVHFEADSDASIVKGLIALLVYVYSDASPDEILATKPTFLEDLGLKEHLSMSRANGLNSMIKQISLYALAFKVKLNS